ncbi:MAG TPA: sensor histidine kinase, partial [Chitinophaga sp.]
MFKQYIGWKFVLASIAVLIIGTTIWFVSNLSRNIQEEERKKVATWVEANRELLRAGSEANLNLAVDIVTNNTTIPLILTDETGKILDSRNLDSLRIMQDPNFLRNELQAFKKQHPPFIMEVDSRQKMYNYIYYGDSLILRQIRYYPYIQLIVVTLFIAIVLF